MKLTEYGSPASAPQLSKEDERSAALARRAQQGDYDDGNAFTGANPGQFLTKTSTV